MQGRLAIRWRGMRRRVGDVRRWLRGRFDAQIAITAVVAALWLVGMFIAGRWYDDRWGEFWQGVYVEAAGAMMDLIVFGIVIGVMVAQWERRRQIRSHQELIDDFKKWNSDEARYRIAGAVRRLNRLGRTSIDFIGMEMTEFAFRAHDIESIAGSKFYMGAWGSGSRDRAVLEEVDFSFVDCRDVVFSAFSPLGGMWESRSRHACLRDCRFEDADLRGATFKGAQMEWTEAPPEEIGQRDRTQEGEPIRIPARIPPFYRADLAGVSFEDVVFRNADFREAWNLRKCRFSGASGLAECMFDSEEDKAWVLQGAGAVS